MSEPLFDALRRAASSDEPAPISSQRARELVQRALEAANEPATDAAAPVLPLRSPLPRWGLVAFGVVAVAGALALYLRVPAAAPLEPAPPVTSTEPTHTQLPSGDRLVARPGAIYVVESARAQRRVRIERGGVLCDVAPLGDGTGFTLVTPHLAIEVLGTVFSVYVDEDATTVWVYEGRVRVRQGGDARVLEAGESTTSRSDALAAHGREAAARRAVAEPAPEAPAPRQRRPRAARGVEPPASLAAVRALLAQGRPEEALRYAERELARGPSADWLVVRADALRALGRHEEGIESLEHAAARAPERRSAIGYRIASTRYRALRDAEGALEALTAYDVCAPGSTMAERGLALEIDANETLGRDRSRGDAVSRYLARFPDTSRAAELRAEGER